MNTTAQRKPFYQLRDFWLLVFSAALLVAVFGIRFAADLRETGTFVTSLLIVVGVAGMLLAILARLRK